MIARIVAAGIFLGGLVTGQSLLAQADAPVDVHQQITAGSDLENYVRHLQSMGKAADYPWSVRPFSPFQLERLLKETSGHPWGRQYVLARLDRRFAEFGAIAPELTVFYNSAFPYGSNDGPVWAGRGLTNQIKGGVFARIGPLTITLAPVFFRAENSDFAGSDSLPVCNGPCGIAAPSVDRPKRFGGRPYQRLDPGASSVQLDLPLLSTGVSTANEWWGPAQEYPLVLGNNAPGFPHLYFQTRSPTPVFLGRVHARLIYGRLEQSPYSPVKGSRRYTSPVERGRVRFASGLLIAFEPRGIDGLEVGYGRFFHFVWPQLGIPPSFARKPLGVLFGSNTGPSGVDENQVASVFARWMFPKSGLEVYGEYGREDNNYDRRDVLQQPDHARAYVLGFRKSYQSGVDAFSAIRGEVVNFQLPTLERTGRRQGLWYRHAFLQQGHTNRGQLLGADVGLDAASASLLAWDRYSTSGKTTLSWERKVRAESGNFHDSGLVNPQSIDVWHAVGAQRTAFLRNFALTGGATIVREFSRDFTGDAWNLNTTVSIQYHVR